MEDEYLNFIRLLNENHVEYVILGGYAVIVHGYIRTTGDIDILINTTEQNADKMLTVMLKFAYNKVVVQTDDISINFISLIHLIKNKQVVGRPKDLEDVRNLTRLH